MKKWFTVLLVLVLIFSFAACARKTGGLKNGKPSTETLSGGTEQSDANLKDVLLENTDGTVKLTFSFVLGSNASEQNEAAMTGLPQYDLSFYSYPMRLVLSVNNLKYWDYQLNSSLNDESGLVLGMFKLLPVNDRTNTVFYLNLSADVTYSVTEVDGKLEVLLKRIDKAPESVYYAVGNFFNEYQDGQLPEEAGLTPTLSDGLNGVVMISQAFPDSASAEALKSQIETEYADSLGGKQLRIVQLTSDMLPAYDDSVDIDALNNKVLIKRNGTEEKFNVYFPDARFLAWSQDGQKALYAKASDMDSDDGIETEQIYLVTNDGQRTKLFDYEMAAVSDAAFSGDGMKIYLIEQINEVQMCNVFDLNTKTLTTIDENVLGTAITGCTWSEDGKSLYFMAGNEMLMVKRYNTETKEVTSLSTVPGIDSNVYVKNNTLYYLSLEDELETVFALNLSTDESIEVAKAEYFTMSADGKYILLRSMDENEEEGYAKLDLYNIQDKTVTPVAKGMMLNDYFFSADSTKIYIISDNAEDTDTFIYSVYEYNIAEKKQTKLFDSINGVFRASYKSDELVMSTTYTKKDGDYPVSYLINCK